MPQAAKRQQMVSQAKRTQAFAAPAVKSRTIQETRGQTQSRKASIHTSNKQKNPLIAFLSYRADDKTAEEYALEGGATLHLVLALRGGSS